ncbi:MAG: PKD domain-containing protein [Candidatus Cryptobacteroides sp.]
MKRSVISAIAIAMCFVACNKAENTPTNHSIDYSAPTEKVSAGTEVTFTDNSLDVASRTWTFQDADPATSSKASVSVVFKSAGLKDVTLSVTFKDNQTLTEKFTVEVTDPIGGTISASALTPMGCIRIGNATKFSISDQTGTPDSWHWTFEGGNPATSDSAEPEVTFDKRIRSAKVTCTLKRNSDGAEITLEQNFVVGNYPVTRDLPDYDIDNLCFEKSKLAGWIAWTEKGSNIGTCGEKKNIYSIAENGANGTGHCLKIDVSRISSEEDGSFADLFPRDGWACNAHIEKGKKYEVSFWWRAEGFGAENAEKWISPTIQVINWFEDWMTVEGTDLTAGNAYSTIFPGEEFTQEGNAALFEDWWGEKTGIGRGSEEWSHQSFEFTAPNTLHNVYPYFRVYTGMYQSVYFDEIEINLIEE